MFRLVSLFCIVAGLSFAAVCAQTENPIEAKVSKNSVVTGELFVYTIKIKGEFSSPKLMLPEFSEELKVISTNQAKNYSYQSASTRIEVAINCILVATKPGKFTIKPATLEDKNKKYSTAPITMDVTGKPLEEKRKALPYLENGTEI
jgi:hypothetical protein